MSTVRRGFTLLETFVVIAIVSVLVSLLFTAVQTVRESARKTQCANNLREIGIATQMFQDSHKKMPFERQPGASVSWRVRLLPFVGNEPLFDAYDTDREWSDPVNEPLRTRMPPLYDCPDARLEPRERASYEALGMGGRRRFRKWIEHESGSKQTQNASPLVAEVNDDYAAVWLDPLPSMRLRMGDSVEPLPEDQTVEEVIQFLKRSPLLSSRGLIGHHSSGFHALYEDGTVRFARELIDTDTLRAMAENHSSQGGP